MLVTIGVVVLESIGVLVPVIVLVAVEILVLTVVVDAPRTTGCRLEMLSKLVRVVLSIHKSSRHSCLATTRPFSSIDHVPLAEASDLILVIATPLALRSMFPVVSMPVVVAFLPAKSSF